MTRMTAFSSEGYRHVYAPPTSGLLEASNDADDEFIVRRHVGNERAECPSILVSFPQ